ncbi:MAG: energy-coupled thiamine transporter ThiT [Candidatus Cloacimonadota bacterium]|nr:MAG: energy-coupled thiamine transporter ThiT [Candidatus Cloacimonadota bacterium]
MDKRPVSKYIEAALFVAMAFVLSQFTIFRLPVGGSVTLGSGVPICICALRLGPKIGMMAGLNFGILSFLAGGVAIGVYPFVCDYILAFISLGAFGFLKKIPLVSICLAYFLRFCFHVLSGVLFFSDGMLMSKAITFSFWYNFTFMLPELILGVFIFYKLIKSSKKVLLYA